MRLEFTNKEIERISPLEQEISTLKDLLKEKEESIKQLKIKNDDQEIRIVELLKGEERLLKLLKSTEQYNEVAVIPYATSTKSKNAAAKSDQLQKKMADLKSSNLVYLEGSKALS